MSAIKMDISDVDACISFIRSAKSDNEKFAAMAVVTKVVKADTSTAHQRLQILHAIGFPFINRLLHTASVPEGCPKTIFQSLALSVLSGFASEATVSSCSEFLSLIPSFIETISLTCSKEADVRQMIDDSYDCLHGILATDDGRKRLIDDNIVPALCHIYTQHIYGSDSALRLLSSLMAMSGSAVWGSHLSDVTDLCTHVARDFCQDKEERKFCICDCLSAIASSTPKQNFIYMSDAGRIPDWVTTCVAGVYELLQNRLADKHRESALTLACSLSRSHGIRCLLPPNTREHKHFLLLVHLVCVEVRMITEDMDFMQVEQSATLLSSCYSLLEQVITHLTTETPLTLDKPQIVSLHSVMVGAFNGVIYFLSNVANQHEDKKMSPIVLASVRVLGAWLAEETAAIRKQVYDILPFLLSICKADLSQFPRNGVCILRLLLPGLCHLTAEDIPRQILIENHLHVILGRYFGEMWAQYQQSHDSEIQVYMELTFGEMWTQYQQSQDPEIQVGLITLCGVLLNITIQETELVTSHLVFREILDLIIAAPSSLNSKSPVLAANMYTLGLMIIRHITSVTVPERTKFFMSVIRFLDIPHSNHKPEAHDNEDIQEQVLPLRFLSNQVFSACVPLFPEIAGLVLDTNLIQNLLKSLLDDSLDEDASAAHLSLVCSLCRENSDVKNLVQDGNGDKIALKYRSTELLHLLSER